VPGVSGPARQAAALGGLGVPAYADPLTAPDEWAELARPGTPLHWVVLNVSGSPGTRADPGYAHAAGRLREAGVRVLGRLDMAYGARTLGELIGDAQHYLDWYRVDGFYLDRAPADRALLAACRRVTGTLGELSGAGDGRGGDRHLVLGHGTHPHPGYAEAADQLVTFNGRWSDYRWSETPQWTADCPPEKFCHLVHGVPRPHLETALRIARWQGAGSVFVTDRDGIAGTDPFEGLPTYWRDLASILRDRPWLA
jgi:hypothetical protein